MIKTNLLKAAIVARGFRQNHVAKMINLHPTRLSSFLNGNLRIKDHYIEKICDVIEIDFKELKKGNIKKK